MKQRIQEIKSQILDHPLQTFLGTVVLGAAGFAAYKLFFKGTSKKPAQHPVEQEKTFQQTYKQVIHAVQQCLNIHQTLNGEVIKCILRNQYKLAEAEFKAFVIKIRNQRRKMIQNKHEYRRLILLMDTSNEQLMDKNLNAILAHLNIEKTDWIETVGLWAADTEENTEEWENLLIELDNQLLDSLRDKKKSSLPYNKLEEIYKFKIYSLKNLGQSGLDLESILTSDDEPDLTSKYTMIEKYIEDLVFKKFGAEEEDILYSERKLGQMDKERIFLIGDEFTRMMREEIYGDNISEVEEDIAAHHHHSIRSSSRKASVAVEGEVHEQNQVQEHPEQEGSTQNKQEGQHKVKQEDADHEEDEGQYF